MRSAILGLLVWSGLAAYAPPARADGVSFLYHRFGEDRYPSTSVRLEQFDAHLEYLETNGFAVWPLERIVAYQREGRAIPDRTVAITVDDAYLSVYSQAYPRLRSRGWPFTVFVATQPVDQGLDGFMSWEQMREMGRHGVSFGNHGVTHDHLVRRRAGESDAAWRQRMRWELDYAQQRLREELGVENRLFAYPYGEYDAALADLVAAAGYVGFGQQSGPIGAFADPRALPRFPMAEEFAPLLQFAGKANSLALPVKSAEPWDTVVREDNPPRLELTLADGLKRVGEMRCYVTGQGVAEVEWRNADLTKVTVRAGNALGTGRSRYNCTIPGPDGRFYWYSHPWLVMER